MCVAERCACSLNRYNDWLSQERVAIEKIHNLAGGQIIKKQGGSNEPPGKERLRGRFLCSPPHSFCHSKFINKFNRVNTVFLSYKLCNFAMSFTQTRGGGFGRPVFFSLIVVPIYFFL